MAIDKTPPDNLEGLTFSPVDAPGLGQAAPGVDAAAAAAAEQEAQMMQAIAAGVAKIVYAGLRALRSGIAKKMPEILEEWPDEMLRGPADAAAPVLQRYMERVSALMGRNPELAMLVVSLVPMGMGFISASEKHSRTVQEVQPKAGTP